MGISLNDFVVKEILLIIIGTIVFCLHTLSCLSKMNYLDLMFSLVFLHYAALNLYGSY